MDGGAVELIARISRLEAVVLTACGLFLIFLDINTPLDPSSLRRRLTSVWSAIARMPVRDVPGYVIGAVMRSIDRFVVYWFEQSERNVATTGIFTLVVFIAIPIAAMLNWLRGGSPVLLVILCACVLGIIALAVLSEIKRARFVKHVLSALLFAAVFLFVPGYVLVSLTDRALNMPIGHGLLASVLLTPLLYLICHSVLLLFAGVNAVPATSLQASRSRRLATLFATALPFAYLGTFVSLLVWHLLLPEQSLPSTWSALLISMTCGALGAAVTIHLATPDRRRTISPRWVGIRLAGGTGAAFLLGLIIRFWDGQPHAVPAVPAMLPLVVPVVLVALVGLALCTKAVLAAAGMFSSAEVASERPYRVAGVLMLLLAVAAGWASLAL